MGKANYTLLDLGSGQIETAASINGVLAALKRFSETADLLWQRELPDGLWCPVSTWQLGDSSVLHRHDERKLHLLILNGLQPEHYEEATVGRLPDMTPRGEFRWGILHPQMVVLPGIIRPPRGGMSSDPLRFRAKKCGNISRLLSAMELRKRQQTKDSHSQPEG